MTGTPPPHLQRRPLNERTRSQNNALAAIRVVPYSPPRPLSITSSELSSSASATAHPAAGLNSGEDNHTDSCRNFDDDSLGKIAYRQPHYAVHAGSPSPSPASRRSSMPLDTVRGRGVSGTQFRSELKARRSSALTALIPDQAMTASPTSPTPNSQGISQLHAPGHDESEDPTTTAASPGQPPSRRRNFFTVNLGKGTFSIQSQTGVRQSQGSSFQAPSLSLSLSTQSSFERLSDLFSNDGRPSSPLSTLPERTPSPCTFESPVAKLAGDHIAASTSSPWNYRLVGGLRKVPATPDTKQNPGRPPFATASSPSEARQSSHLPNLPDNEEESHSLVTKTSFQSSQSASTASEKTNYKVYGASTPAPADTVTYTDGARPTSPSDSDNSASSNYQILARSSPAPALSTIDPSPPKTADSDISFTRYADLSPSASPSGGPSRLRSEFSQESLIVPPLRTTKKRRSSETLTLYKSRSRESFRTGSLTAINNIIGQEAIQAFLAAPLALRRPSGSSGFSGIRSDPWTVVSSDIATHNPAMQSHPHQWSSQLSTVHSESERGSLPASRSVSPLSASGRRSAGFLSNHSRQLPSISSSLAAYEDNSNSQSLSVADSLERPQPALVRGTTVRLVRDQDEDGDGLGELRDIHHPLHQRPSRRLLGSLFSSSSSDRNLHSSGSSRSNSFSSGTIPTWAKLYYGSGEHRYLRHAVSSESMTQSLNDSRPSSSFRTGSPSAENLPLNIYSPRRRPHEIRPPPVARPTSDAGSLEINSVPVQNVPLRSTLRHQTSSIWSPHLVRDHRASGYSMWEPPSVDWSTESGPLGRRNVQVILFIVGFIMPLAWMAAACLPLPPRPQPEMMQQPSDSLLDVPRPNTRQNILLDDRQHYSARWWRNVNRIMSIVGLLVIAVIVTLSVVGVKQGWGR